MERSIPSRKIPTKYVSGLLVMVLLLNLIAPGLVSASVPDSKIKISVSNAVGRENDLVTLQIRLEDVVGADTYTAAGGDFELHFDRNLLESVPNHQNRHLVPGPLLSGKFSSQKADHPYGIKVAWASTDDIEESGVLFTITFKLKSNVDADVKIKNLSLFYGDTEKGKFSASRITIVDGVVATLKATPAGGTYGQVQKVALSTTIPSSIYYTTDGSNPSAQSVKYESPIDITENRSLKFMAVLPSGFQSQIYTEEYVIDTSIPTAQASPAGGLFNQAKVDVTLTMSKPGDIHYTLNGDEPTKESPKYSAPIAITETTTLKFLAIDTVGNKSEIYSETYTFDRQAPTASASPQTGLFNADQVVTLTMSEPGDIYFTTDGTEPVVAPEKKYTAPITISTTTTLKFVAVDKAGNMSDVYTETYTIDKIKPTASAAPKGGLFKDDQVVTLTMSKAGAIYYTTNGSTPTKDSTVYAAPITIDANTTLKFVAIDLAGNVSEVYEEIYTFDRLAPVVTATPKGGLFNADVEVTLNINEEGEIYYTTNGDTPTKDSTKYTGKITVATDTTLKFFGIDKAGNASVPVSETYTFDREAPTAEATPKGGIFRTKQAVTLTMSEKGSVYFTVDGTPPTTSSTKYTQPIDVEQTATIKFIAVDEAGNVSPVYTESYTIDTVAPTVAANPKSDVYNVDLLITLTMNEAGDIYYTVDGTTPTKTSTKYTAPISVKEETTLKFFAVDLAGNESEVGSETYTFDRNIPVVTAGPAGGLFKQDVTVTLTMNKDGKIYYTTNGAEPTVNSTEYSTPIAISATTTLKFFGVDLVGNKSSVVTEQYTIDKVAPVITISPKGSLSNAEFVMVAITINEDGDIYYTLDGSTPTTQSEKYTVAIKLTDNTTLKVLAVDKAGNESQASEQYVFDRTPPTVTVNPVGGLFNADVSVELTASEEASIYYTLNGTEPTTASSKYTGPISLTQTATVKFLAVDLAGNSSIVYTETYTIDKVAPTASASPAGKTFRESVTVELSMSEEGDIFYTVDGSEPTSSSTKYGAALTFVDTTTLKFIAIDKAGNKSPIYTQNYTKDTVAPAITLVGNATVYHEVKTAYNDLGATASDDQDGVITSRIVVTSTVDKDKLGTYKVTYNVTDAAGNEATAVERTVIVRDTTVPVITLKGSKTVYVQVGGTYTDQGATATDNYDGNITSQIVVTTNVDAKKVGTYWVKYNVTDSSNNKAVEVTRTVVVQQSEPTDTEAVAFAKGGLTFNRIKGTNTSASEITSNLTLPTVDALNNVSISWSSNNAAISSIGQVTRPAWDKEDVTVTLTATLTKYHAKDTVTFTLVVKKMEATAEQLATRDVEQALKALTFATIQGENLSRDQITGTLNLVRDLNGVTVTWTSSDVAVISPTGLVTRPAWNESADSIVTLKATLQKGNVTRTVDFVVTVKRAPEPTRTVLGSNVVNKETKTESSGTVVETFTLTNNAAQQIASAKSEGKTTVEFEVNSSTTGTVATEVKVPAQILTAAQDMSLAVTSPKATLELPKELVNALAKDGKALDIRVEPASLDAVTAQKPTNAEVVGAPVSIKTALVGKTKVTIPCNINLPTIASEREAMLRELGMFVIHSDGSKQTIYDLEMNITGNVLVSVTFWVDKFSTFTLVKAPQQPKVLRTVVGERGYYVDTAKVDMVECYYKGNDTMMPVRMLEALGATFEWNEATKTATMSYKGKVVELTIGSTTAKINGVATPIVGASGKLMAPELKPGRTMIPLRFVSEQLGFKVTWDPSNLVTITSSN